MKLRVEVEEKSLKWHVMVTLKPLTNEMGKNE
jgi:hypothetical protein